MLWVPAGTDKCYSFKSITYLVEATADPRYSKKEDNGHVMRESNMTLQRSKRLQRGRQRRILKRILRPVQAFN